MATDWKEARKEFESTEVGISELAARHGLSPSTVRKRAGREGWKKKIEACRPEKKNDGADAESRSQDVLSCHRSLWMGVKKRLVKGLESRDSKLGLEELKVAKIAGEVLTSVDTFGFPTLGALRERLAGIIEGSISAAAGSSCSLRRTSSKRASRSSDWRRRFSWPEISWMISPLCIMIKRSPRLAACCME